MSSKRVIAYSKDRKDGIDGLRKVGEPPPRLKGQRGAFGFLAAFLMFSRSPVGRLLLYFRCLHTPIFV